MLRAFIRPGLRVEVLGFRVYGGEVGSLLQQGLECFCSLLCFVPEVPKKVGMTTPPKNCSSKETLSTPRSYRSLKL